MAKLRYYLQLDKSWTKNWRHFASVFLITAIDKSDLIWYNIKELCRQSRHFYDEESPSIKRTGCWLTASGGDSRNSATEINRLPRKQVRMERWCKRPPLS